MLIDGYDQFYNDWISVSERYPQLLLCSDSTYSQIRGYLDIIDAHGTLVDTYELMIRPQDSYPNSFPLVYEIGGKIPKNIDWHVFESDGHLCIATWPVEKLRCSEDFTLGSFIEQDLKPYLFNQTYRRIQGYFLHDRAHGFYGEWQEYQDTFKTANPIKIISLLDYILKRNEPIRVADCFCGSSLKYRKCHRDTFRRLNKLSDNVLMEMRKRIIASNQFQAAYSKFSVRQRLSSLGMQPKLK